MKVVLMNLQNSLFAEAVERFLRGDGDFRILNVRHPGEVLRQSELTHPEIAFLEVTRYPLWTFDDRIRLRDSLKAILPSCKIVLMTDEDADLELADEVKTAKIQGLIDGFVYSSVSMTYLSAYLQTI